MLCICICICLCIYIYIHLYIYMCICIYIYIYMYVYIYIHLCQCIHMYVTSGCVSSWENISHTLSAQNLYTHIQIHMYIYTSNFVDVFMGMWHIFIQSIALNIYIYVYLYMYIYLYMYVYKHMFIYVSICVDVYICIYLCRCIYTYMRTALVSCSERWGAGVETQKIVRREIWGWGRVPFNETYAPSLSTIYDGA